MQNRWILSGSIGVLAAAALAACAGKTPEPEAAEAESAADSAGEADQAGPAASAKPAEEEEEQEELPDKTPTQILTEDGVAFAFSFQDSDVGKKAEENCAKKSKDDPQKKAACMKKARDRYPEEGIHFKKDPEGKWWFVTYGKHRGKPADLHRIECEFGEEKGNQVTVKLKGPDKGSKRMGSVPRELVIQVPDDYSILIDDPAKGNVIYKTRVGATDPE
jgi:hypothetical protein